eukprot:1124890-Pleurochrysis_carterae.AAC.2
MASVPEGMQQSQGSIFPSTGMCARTMRCSTVARQLVANGTQKEKSREGGQIRSGRHGVHGLRRAAAEGILNRTHTREVSSEIELKKHRRVFSAPTTVCWRRRCSIKSSMCAKAAQLPHGHPSSAFPTPVSAKQSMTGNLTADSSPLAPLQTDKCGTAQHPAGCTAAQAEGAWRR